MRLSPIVSAAVVVGSLVLVAGSANGLPRGPRARASRPALEHRPEPSRAGVSVGAPNEGRLIGGARLETTPFLRISPAYAGSNARWALERLVGLVADGARAVRERFPDSVLSVGHLSRAGGGDIQRHHSHESGRDADLGFFIRDAAGRPLLADGFVSFDGDGRAASWPGAYFDDARNWALVEAILREGRVNVTHVFLAEPLRDRLLAFAQRAGAPASLRQRAARLMMQPRDSTPHDDHFHVRIGCPARMADCVEHPSPRKDVVLGAKPSL